MEGSLFDLVDMSVGLDLLLSVFGCLEGRGFWVLSEGCLRLFGDFVDVTSIIFVLFLGAMSVERCCLFEGVAFAQADVVMVATDVAYTIVDGVLHRATGCVVVGVSGVAMRV